MKTKIKAALKQAYETKLGLKDEDVFERVASAVETFITDEAQIENFVKGAEPMLKSYQSVADKIRGEYSQKIKDLEAKIEVQEPKNQVVEEPKDDVAKISEVVKSALASSELLKNMQEQFAALQAEKDATTKLNNAKAKFDKDDWANSNKQIANIAWKQAIKRYEDKGKKMTEDELFAEAKSNLTDLFSLKGMDATKPFESEGAGDSFDATEFEKIYVANGRIPKKDN